MQIGEFNLEMISSLMLIGGAGVAAVMCDSLRSNNQKLREINTGLQARQEALRRRFRTRIAAAPRPVLAAQNSPQRALPAPEHALSSPTLGTTSAIARTSEQAASPNPAHQTRSSRSHRRLLESGMKRGVSAAALDAMERGARLAAGAEQTERAAVPRNTETAPFVVTAPPISLRPRAAKSQPDTSRGSRRDWGALLASRKSALAPTPAEQPALAAAPTGFQDLPAGLQDGFVLSLLIEKARPVNGLVVAIGTDSGATAGPSATGHTAELRAFLRSLLGPADFAAQSSESSFVLVLAEQDRVAAQRRLKEISRRLVDFQLRSQSASPVRLHWGGVEVHNQPLDAAIESANRSMRDVPVSPKGLSPKVLSMEPANRPPQHPETQLKEAV